MGYAPPASGDLPVECAACGEWFHAKDLRAGATVDCTSCSTAVIVGELALVKRKRMRWSSKRCEERLERIAETLGPPPPECAGESSRSAPEPARVRATPGAEDSRWSESLFAGLMICLGLAFGILYGLLGWHGDAQ